MTRPATESVDDTDLRLARVARLFDGVVPHLHRVLARSPVALRAFVDLEAALDGAPTLGRGAHALIALEVALAAGCRYCEGVFVKEAAAAGVAPASVDAVRRGGVPTAADDARVVRAARRLIESDGRLGRFEMAEFARRGLGERELLEISTVIATYALATRANNLARTRIDPEYRLDD
jgi:alkylhydroperoxidase family enzyme